ncbi:MBL fold metallo-hydrolase [uncultured Selenomonas sp.]|uniref:MBL fold metallo-hydrolase n=1 Tax=uncultured Selenomonas sp. TaxID=159275 RepID=UPI0025D2F64D|nr:MBL fold metallo-hydrolase [uncultured Selenomonas sp.]
MIFAIPVEGPILTNCYLFADDETHHGFLIDPGFEPERIVRAVQEKAVTVEKILITHGHFDHMTAARAVAKNINAPICASTRSQKYFESPTYNLSKFFETGETIIPEDEVTYLADGTTVALENGALALRLVPTPGHTEDGTIYVGEGVAFVGDTIFRASYGATHFPGGDEGVLIHSIKTKILTLPDDTVLLSGHSEPTTVGEEKTRPWYQ